MSTDGRLKALVFLGSRRTSAPPSPPRLGERVARHLAGALAMADFDVELVDPLDLPLEASFKPVFAYPPGAAPAPWQELLTRISAADAYVMVSPEYNHSMSPALADLLNHFPSSAFSYRPSLIATYSAGQWGGARAAVNLRTFLSELGCLPVSAMLHVPRAQEVFAADGSLADPALAAHWAAYVGRGVAQLRWWAEATREQRARRDPFAAAPAFARNPSERNAPG